MVAKIPYHGPELLSSTPLASAPEADEVSVSRRLGRWAASWAPSLDNPSFLGGPFLPGLWMSVEQEGSAKTL